MTGCEREGGERERERSKPKNKKIVGIASNECIIDFLCVERARCVLFIYVWVYIYIM